jgi:hypothetical protein
MKFKPEFYSAEHIQYHQSNNILSIERGFKGRAHRYCTRLLNGDYRLCAQLTADAAPQWPDLPQHVIWPAMSNFLESQVPFFVGTACFKGFHSVPSRSIDGLTPGGNRSTES